MICACSTLKDERMSAVCRDGGEEALSIQKDLSLQSLGSMKHYSKMRELWVIYYGGSAGCQIRNNRKLNRRDRKQVVKGLLDRSWLA